MTRQWYSCDSPEAQTRLVAAFPDAPVENEEVCEMLLEVAREQILAYAPALAPADPLPARYVYAQLKQAEVLWAAGTASGDGDIGSEGYRFTPRPLDKTIQQIIRPKTGTANVF